MAQNTAQRWFIGSYRHLQPYPKGNLYYEVRKYLGLSQARMASLFGVSVRAWQYRERVKRMYHCAEIAALQEVSGLDAESFMKFLKDVA
jgi:transcriptional regulator with XRE-family HTH domain